MSSLRFELALKVRTHHDLPMLVAADRESLNYTRTILFHQKDIAMGENKIHRPFTITIKVVVVPKCYLLFPRASGWVSTRA